MLAQILIFIFARAIEVKVANYSRCFAFRGFLNKDIDAYTLHDIKDILVFATIRASLFLTGITVQIKDVYLIKDAHQFRPHLAMDKTINEGVIGDICHNTFAITFYVVLR